MRKGRKKRKKEKEERKGRKKRKKERKWCRSRSGDRGDGRGHEVSLVTSGPENVANSGCNGNDLRLGFYAVEWNRFNGDEDR